MTMRGGALKCRNEIADFIQNKLKAKEFSGDGDFRSDESITLLQQSDIVVTNPPFSLFREYVAQLIKYEKKFIIIGNLNSATYKEVFPLIKNNKIWLGASIHSGDREFGVPEYYPLKAASSRIDENGKRFIRVKGVRWFVNLDYPRRHDNLETIASYSKNPEKYPKYENYNAINIDETAEIPMDYESVMGVPISFLDKYNPEQFEILECHEPAIRLDILRKMPKFKEYKSRQIMVNGTLCQKKYHRFFIQKRKDSK